MIKIAPSILSADFGRLAEEIRLAEEAGVDLIHIDVMDGHFVPNITIGPVVVEAIRRVTRLPLDVHLMITDPERYVREFIEAGANYVTVHVEACTHLHRAIWRIKDLEAKAGVALNPATPILMLEEILPDVDLILIMTVNPGFGGQPFISSCLKKVIKTKEKIKEVNSSVLLEVDGGIKLENAKQVAEAGADILVIGSAFFQQKDYKAFVQKLRELLRS